MLLGGARKSYYSTIPFRGGGGGGGGGDGSSPAGFLIGHLRVAVNLIMKARLSAKLFV